MQVTEMNPGAKTTPAQWGVFGVVIPLILTAVDQLSKWWATGFFDKSMNICATQPDIRLTQDISPVMDISLLCNQGISWGLMQGDSPVKRWFLTGLAAVMVVIMLVALWRTTDKLTRWALTLVIGGAIGNGIDRALFGAVTDFIDFSDLKFNYVFNIADSAITVGIIVLLAASFIGDRAEKRAKEAVKSASAE